MAQNGVENNYYLNQFNDPLDNIFVEQGLNSTDINKSILDNKNQANSPSSNSQKTNNLFQNGYIGGYNDVKNTRFKKYNQSQNNNKNKRKASYNQSIGNTTPNRSFLTKSKLSINSKNNSSYKNLNRKNSGSNLSFKFNLKLRNNSQMSKNNNNFMRKDPNKEAIILGKLTEEIEHIKNYCNELQRQFDNHCLIKNEKKEFENIKKENIKLTAEVSILKDDVAELMKKYGIINNKIDSMQQENNNLKIQNKNLLNFISIMSNSNSINGIKKLKNFNMNINNHNNESMNMNIIKLNNNNESKAFNEIINNNNNKNNDIYNINNNLNNFDKLNFNINNNNNFNLNNLNSEQIEFSISKSMSKNFEKPELNSKNYFKTINNNNNESRFDYTNANTNSNTNINIQSKTQSDFHTMGTGNKNLSNNATDIISLIQSNFNLTNHNRNSSNSKGKQNRFLIPKDD